MRFSLASPPFASLLVMILATTTAGAEPPHIPRPAEVVRYERTQPVFQSMEISKERGDALLALLDGGQAVERWLKEGIPPGVVCVLPPPPRLHMTFILTNGTNYQISLSHNGSLLFLPEGSYVIADEPRSKQVAEWMAAMEADLRREMTNAPKPCVYEVGTVDDADTLSDIARLFYGDASKWRQIYEANRSVIKDPNVIMRSQKLTIPQLK